VKARCVAVRPGCREMLGARCSRPACRWRGGTPLALQDSGGDKGHRRPAGLQVEVQGTAHHSECRGSEAARLGGGRAAHLGGGGGRAPGVVVAAGGWRSGREAPGAEEGESSGGRRWGSARTDRG
jgi:hypothetical protein